RPRRQRPRHDRQEELRRAPATRELHGADGRDHAREACSGEGPLHQDRYTDEHDGAGDPRRPVADSRPRGGTGRSTGRSTRCRVARPTPKTAGSREAEVQSRRGRKSRLFRARACGLAFSRDDSMLKSEKERVVAELAERLGSTETLMVADYRGLTMTEIDELRTRLLEAGARFTVVKNTLTRLAAEEAGAKDVLDLIEGPTAIAFLEADSDPAAVAKVLNETARARDVLVIRGGILDGELVADADIKRLATLPPTEVLHAELVGAVAGPLTTVVGLFTAPLRDLVGVIDARIRQLEEQGAGAPEPEAETPAEEAQAE